MRKQLKRRNTQRMNAIFKEGRRMFPRSEFDTISYMGKIGKVRIFSAKEAYSAGGVGFETEASWG